MTRDDLPSTPGTLAREELRRTFEQGISRQEWLIRAVNDVGDGLSTVLFEARVVELRALLDCLAKRESWQRNTEEQQELRERLRRADA